MKRSLTALVSRGILREEESRGGVEYRFEDPFLGAWVEFFAARL